MKKLILVILCIFIIPVVFAEPNISKEIPAEIEEGDIVEINIIIEPNSAEILDVAEMIPSNWHIRSWDVEPELEIIYESKNHEFPNAEGEYNINHWKLKEISENIIITYKLEAEEVGEFDLRTILIYPEGFESFSEKITINEKEESEFTPSPLTGRIVGTEMEITEEESEFGIDSNIFSNVKESIYSIKY